MMSASPPGAPTSLRDGYSKGKEDVGLASYFGGVGKGIPPLVDVPPELASMVLHGGLAPLGEAGRVPHAAALHPAAATWPRCLLPSP